MIVRGGANLLFNYINTYKAQIFNRGQSSKVFREVHEKNKAVCVIRNSEPYVAIIPHSMYIEMCEKMKCIEKAKKGDGR